MSCVFLLVENVAYAFLRDRKCDVVCLFSIRAEDLDFVRDTSKQYKALREAICGHVRPNLKVVRMPRPSRMRDQAARVLNALFPPDQQDWLYTTDQDGNQIKGQYLEDLEAFAYAVEFGSSEHRIVNY